MPQAASNSEQHPRDQLAWQSGAQALSGAQQFYSCTSADLTTESQHHVVASLVERAEAAEVQTRQLQSELAALRQSASARAAAGGAGSAAAISAAEVSCRELQLFPDRPEYLPPVWRTGKACSLAADDVGNRDATLIVVLSAWQLACCGSFGGPSCMSAYWLEASPQGWKVRIACPR